MSIAEIPRLMTTDELLALPDDGVERELIRGQLREREMTPRNWRHGRIESKIAHLLGKWLDSQPQPRGHIGSGEVGFRIRRNPDTTVGIDIAFISPETAAATDEDARLIEGPPILAVEILSPSDQQQDITDKIEDYLLAGVKLVWLVEPVFRTITIYRPDAPPMMVNNTQQLTAEPHLPGFKTAVSAVFDA